MDAVYQEEIGFEIDATDVDPSEDLHASNFVSKEGWYHVTVCDGIKAGNVDDEGKPLPDKLRTVEMKLQVLRGTGDGGVELKDQIDKYLGHTLYIEGWKKKPVYEGRELIEPGTKGPLEDKSLASLLAFCEAFGISKPEDRGKKIKMPFHLLVGKQAIVHVQQDDDYEKDGKVYKGRMKIRWNNDVYPLDHEKVADVLKAGTASAAAAAALASVPADDDLGDI